MRSGNENGLSKVRYHLFLLPVYVTVLLAAAGACLLLYGLWWVTYNHWDVVLIVIGAIILLCWAFAAFDHVERHGWRPRPNESVKSEDDLGEPKIGD